MLGTLHFTNIKLYSTLYCNDKERKLLKNIFHSLTASISQDCLSLFYSQGELLEQLRARKVKLEQSKSDRITQLMSEGGRSTTTARPHHRLDPQHLEAPLGPASPLTDSSLDQLLARLESLEVGDLNRQREREGSLYFQERKSEIGLMSVRDDGAMCVVKVRISSHHHHHHQHLSSELNKCR